MNTDKSRDDLAAEANRVREELVETVGQLDHLRRDPLGVGGRVGQALAWVAAFGGVVVVAGGAATFLFWRRESSVERVRRDRRRLLSDAWHRPARLLRAEQPPFVVRLTQALALGVLTTAVKLFSKQLVARLAAPHADLAIRTDVRKSRIA
jgi:hypothetical protein